MKDSIEKQIRDQTRKMYDSAPPIGDLLPSDMAEELGVEQTPDDAITLRKPSPSPRVSGQWVGAAVFLVVLLVSIPAAIWLTTSEQGGFLAEPDVPVEQPRQGMMQNPANGHFYELVSLPSNVDAAKTEAAATSFRGVPGHLVTITSEQEDLFVWRTSQEMLTSAGDPDGPVILGATQPEGSIEPSFGWEWVTGEPFSYTNWGLGEPNNSGGSENCIEYVTTSGSPAWNDLKCPDAGASGYWIVEYDIGSP